jgi:hypothetical protein
MRKSPKFSPEVQERAVHMVVDAKDQYPSEATAGAAAAGCSQPAAARVESPGHPRVARCGRRFWHYPFRNHDEPWNRRPSAWN